MSKGAHFIKHGMHGTPEYMIWKDMRKRCNNPKSKGFARYGGRGITVCKEWDDFEVFLRDVGPKPQSEDKITLDRIDNNRGYEPGNCRWVTNKVNCRNQEKTRFLTFNGETRCIADWAEHLGIRRKLIHERIDTYGWSVERALTEPAGDPQETRHIEYNGIIDTLRGWERRTGLPRQTIRIRIDHQGWSVDKALTTPGRKHGTSAA